MTNDDLDLARAKAIYGHMFPERDWHQETDAWLKGRYLDCARAIRTADAAMGVVSVPVEATEEIIASIAGKLERPSAFDGRPSLRAAIRAQDIYHTALSASPLQEKETNE